MTHFQDEGHYQAEMNARAEAEYDAMMQDQVGQGESEQAIHGQDLDVCPSPDAPTSPQINVEEPKFASTRELTFGERLVGITFNPSGDAKVQRAKELCSELADLISNDYLSKESSALHSVLFNHAVGEILNAQMNVVKVLTFKN